MKGRRLSPRKPRSRIQCSSSRAAVRAAQDVDPGERKEAVRVAAGDRRHGLVADEGGLGRGGLVEARDQRLVDARGVLRRQDGRVVAREGPRHRRNDSPLASRPKNTRR